MPAVSTLGRIEEADEEDERPSTCYSHRDSRIRKKQKNETLTVNANRFDFRINNKYRIQNIKVDESGDRIKALSHLHGRVVARHGLTYQPVKFDSKDPRKSVAI